MRLIVEFPDNLDIPGIFDAEYPDSKGRPRPHKANRNIKQSDEDVDGIETAEEFVASQVRNYIVGVVEQYNVRQAIELAHAAAQAESQNLPVIVAVEL